MKNPFLINIIVFLMLFTNIYSQDLKFSSEHDVFFTGIINMITVDDLNNDGKLDIVAAGFDFIHSLVLLSVSLNNTPNENSSPVFSDPIPLSVNYRPKIVRTNDINMDGKADIIVSDTDSSLYVYLNSTTAGASDLTFENKVEFNTGFSIVGFAIGDINLDGKMDLITSNFDGHSVSILLNNTPTNSMVPVFSQRQDIDLPNSPHTLSVSDFNNDGKPDIAITTSDNKLSIFINLTPIGNSTPIFSESTDYTLSELVLSISSTDLNGDLKSDIVVTKPNEDSVTIYLNNTEIGSLVPDFLNIGNFATGNNPRFTELKDFNRDGKLDMLTANLGQHSFSILKNTTVYGETDLNFEAKKDFTVSKGQIYSAVADFNNDGRNDIALAFEQSNVVGVFFNETQLNFQKHSDFQTTFGASAMDKADFNNDNKPDLVTGNFGNFTILLGNGDATFQTHYEISLNKFSPNLSVAVADYNGDNNDDVAITNGNGNNYVSIFLGNGAGQFSSESTFATERSPMGMSKGDFNNDTFVDLVTSNADINSMSILLGNGDGTFLSAVNYTTALAPVYSNVNDFNTDGNQDIAIANQNSNSVSLFLGNGDGTFGEKNDFEVGNTPIMLISSDFNNDLVPDLAVVNSFANSISILLGNGDGTFAAKVDYTTGSAPIFEDTGDFNKDGFVDIAVSNQNNAVSILYNQGNGIFAPFVDFPVGSGPFQVVAVDLNNDGDIDIATANSATDSVSILINQINLLTSVDSKDVVIPNNIILEQNYPNPFNPSTKIKFSIPKSGFVRLNIYDLLGRNVKTLINEAIIKGFHFINFNALNLSSGIYFYRLEFNSSSKTKKMILLR